MQMMTGEHGRSVEEDVYVPLASAARHLLFSWLVIHADNSRLLIPVLCVCRLTFLFQVCSDGVAVRKHCAVRDQDLGSVRVAPGDSPSARRDDGSPVNRLIVRVVGGPVRRFHDFWLDAAASAKVALHVVKYEDLLLTP